VLGQELNGAMRDRTDGRRDEKEEIDSIVVHSKGGVRGYRRYKEEKGASPESGVEKSSL